MKTLFQRLAASRQPPCAQVLGPLLEVDFSENSDGYRPGCSALQAVAVMQRGWKEGRRNALECDLKLFFDTVNHDRLMQALLEKVRFRKTLGLIRRYLTAGVELPDGTREAMPQGVQQGGLLSLLLVIMTNGLSLCHLSAAIDGSSPLLFLSASLGRWPLSAGGAY